MTQAEAVAVLELTSPFTDDELKKAYHDLRAVWNPARFFDNESMAKEAQEKSKHLDEAFVALSKALFSQNDRPTAKEPNSQIRPITALTTPILNKLIKPKHSDTFIVWVIVLSTLGVGFLVGILKALLYKALR